MLPEKSDLVGVTHNSCLGSLKHSWAHCPPCFLNPLFTPLLEHLIYYVVTFHGCAPLPQQNVCLVTLCYPLCRVTVAHHGQTGWGDITVNSRWAYKKAGFCFLILRQTPIRAKSRERNGPHQQFELFIHNLTQLILIIMVINKHENNKCIYSV